jgi:hypothetical protein
MIPSTHVFRIRNRHDLSMSSQRFPAVLFGMALIVVVAIAVVGPANASASSKGVRTEKASGACVTLPTSLFPNKGIAEDGDLSVTATKERTVRIVAHPSYAELLSTEIPGWVNESFRVDKVSKDAKGYRVVGLWEDNQTETGGPWHRRVLKTAKGAAVSVDFFFLTADYNANTTKITKAIASVRSC